MYVSGIENGIVKSQSRNLHEYYVDYLSNKFSKWQDIWVNVGSLLMTDIHEVEAHYKPNNMAMYIQQEVRSIHTTVLS